MHQVTATLAICLTMLPSSVLAQSSIPGWCRVLPRPEYKSLDRVAISDPWFEVYKPASNVFAIYEPHQSEEVISYLIVGDKRALLFDTGMGISDIKKVTAELTKLPVIVLNSHTHNDHVGGNWEFATIYGMDTDFTRNSARAHARMRRLRSLLTKFAVPCPMDSMRRPTPRVRGRLLHTLTTAIASILEVEPWKSSQRQATRLMRFP